MKNNLAYMTYNLSKLLSKKNIFVILILSLTFFFLKNSFKDIQLEELNNTLKNTNLLYIALWLLLCLINTAIRSLRWKFLIPNTQVNFFDLFHSLNIGNLASMILPFRAGEFVRPFYLNEWTKIGFPKAMTSVVIERVFDVLGMFTVYYFFVKDIEHLPEFMVLSSKGLGFISLILSCGMCFSRFFPKLVKKLAEFIFNFLPLKLSNKLITLCDEVIEGLGSIKTITQLVLIIFLTLLIWAIYVTSFAILLSAFGAETKLAVGAVVCVFVGLAIAAPNAPGFILTFELGCTLALGVFAYTKEFSLAFALIAHALQFFSAVFIGLFSLIKKGLSLSSLKSGV
jgi:uncharacterized protein (TIRG00374 family)